MNTLFKNKTIYTKEEYLRFQKYHLSRANLIFYSIFMLLNYILIGVSVTLIMFQNQFGYIYLVIGLIITIYFKLLPYLITMKFFSEDKFIENLENDYAFFEDHLEIHNMISDISLRYDQLYKVYESVECFYIYISIHQTYIVNKRNFIQGTAPNFSKFIREKLDMEYIKRY